MSTIYIVYVLFNKEPCMKSSFIALTIQFVESQAEQAETVSHAQITRLGSAHCDGVG